MKPEELEALFKAIVWLPETEGAYKGATISSTVICVGGFTGRWAKREPDSRISSADMVEKWNTIHQKPYQAYLLSDGSWITPYLGNTPAPDSLVAQAVLAIYRRTGEIIISAAHKHCFILHEGKAHCVQIEITAEEELLTAGDASYIDTHRAIAHLLGLESCLSFADIRGEDSYFTLDMIQKLILLQAGTVRLTPDLIKKLPDMPIHQLPFLVENMRELIVRNATQFIPDENFYELIVIPSEKRLHLAAELGLLGLIETEIKYGRRINFLLMPGGLSPLMVAARSKRIKGHRESFLEALIEWGAYLNIQANWEGQEGHEEDEGFTALDYAEKEGHEGAIAMLRGYGAFTRKEISDMQASRDLLRTISWSFLGKGRYNKVDCSNELEINGLRGKFVKKTPCPTESNARFSNARRAVKIWGHIYPQYPAILSTNEKNNGIWVVQYFGCRAPSDCLIAEAMLKLYKEKGIIVMDGCGDGNTRLFNDQVLFVDLDLVTGYGLPPALTFDISDIREKLEGYYNHLARVMPLSVMVLRNLLYLDDSLSAEVLKKIDLTMETIFEIDVLRQKKEKVTTTILATLRIASLKPIPSAIVHALERHGLFRSSNIEAELAAVPIPSTAVRAGAGAGAI